MGMFDNIKVKKPLPLNKELEALSIDWSEEVFQTKDLDNLLDLYEITEDGKLKHLVQEREWEKNDTSPFGGHLELKSEHWEEVPFHGVVRFYTSYCDKVELDNELVDDPKNMSWQDIFEAQGFDWWIEFLAIFDNGIAREIRIEKVEKTPISARLASSKEWSIKREIENQKLLNKTVKKLRKIPGYNYLLRKLSRLEQKGHEKLSWGLRKIS